MKPIPYTSPRLPRPLKSCAIASPAWTPAEPTKPEAYKPSHIVSAEAREEFHTRPLPIGHSNLRNPEFYHVATH